MTDESESLAATSLDRLNDIVVDNLSIPWPLAPGALTLLLALVVLTALRGYRSWRRYRANAYRRVALARLHQAQRDGDVTAIPELLKRVAITAYGEQRVAALSGSSWLSFLDTVSATSAQTNAFAHNPGAVISRLPYEPQLAKTLDDGDKQQLFHQSAQWIAHHKVAG